MSQGQKVDVVKTNVAKAMIVPYVDKLYQQTHDRLKPFVLPVNPETYSQNYKVEYNTQRAGGQQRTDPRYVSTAPEELRLEFILDGTNTIEGYYNPNRETVHEQFIRLRDTVYTMNGNIHKPNWVKVFWGELEFQGVLSNLDINYTLFDSEGKPLRAKVSATFTDFVAQEERAREEDTHSPDLTKSRRIVAGDRLDLLTYNFYNDSKYVVQVAKTNGLTTFRKVSPGREIVFPPFNKEEK